MVGKSNQLEMIVMTSGDQNKTMFPTVRDLFAAHALVAIFGVPESNGSPQGMAKVAFVLADAMMAARDEGKPDVDDDPWVAYDGSGMPVGEQQLVSVRRRYGHETKSHPASFFNWGWSGRDRSYEIIAYKVVS